VPPSWNADASRSDHVLEHDGDRLADVGRGRGDENENEFCVGVRSREVPPVSTPDRQCRCMVRRAAEAAWEQTFSVRFTPRRSHRRALAGIVHVELVYGEAV